MESFCHFLSALPLSELWQKLPYAKILKVGFYYCIPIKYVRRMFVDPTGHFVIYRCILGYDNGVSILLPLDVACL